MKISLKFKKSDIFVLIGSVVFVIALIVSSLLMNINNKANTIEVTYYGELVHTMHLDTDETFTMKQEDYPGLLGDLTIVVENKKVRVDKQTSPLNYCEYMGEQDRPGTAIICAPNGVVVTIKGYVPGEPDWVM